MKTTCVDIEIAIMRKFDFRQNLIVPNITKMMGLVPFETDVLILTKASYAIGFEIKTSKSDLMADFKKPQHTKFNEFKNGKSGFERYFGKFKHFYYAVPKFLEEDALTVIPDFCGLYSLTKWIDGTSTLLQFNEVKQAKKLFNYKWTDKQRYEVARLGAMRIYSLKQTLNSKT